MLGHYEEARTDFEGFGRACALGEIFRSQSWAGRIGKSKQLGKALVVWEISLCDFLIDHYEADSLTKS